MNLVQSIALVVVQLLQSGGRALKRPAQPMNAGRTPEAHR
jgi:hypothetical protein